MRHGDVPVGVGGRLGAEFYVQQYVNTNLTVVNGENILYIGSFTMPFAGSAIVSFWNKLQWRGGESFLAVSMAAQSTPPPTDTVDNLTQSQIPGTDFTSVVDIPSYAYWANLASGQGVTMISRVYVGGVLPYFEWSLALVRCFRP